ncbi:unnamed protein product [Oppiella nova]|uniref:Nuclear receptor domain-containing protein n=1 Tax=Oppiella nova TaxID=334625 RepID=A0A7R9LHV6_9ACAR|nr:unnamed protein product [Oppiella nova]CAG2163687.1 unnamed protein product [Oppiella nova]
MNRINKRLPKICGVCGNRAMGHNFGALSCEPCKAFFRRNAFRDNLKCHFNSNCKITEITRKFCSKCRLDKCFAVGMRRDWMPCEDKCETQTDDSCVQNDGLNSEDSSTKSVTNSQDSDNNDILYDLLDINSDNKFSPEELNAQIVDLEGIVDNNLQGSSKSETSTNEYHGYQCSCSEPLPPDTSTDLDDISDDIIQKSVEFEFSVIPIARPIAEYKCNFNETESFMLNELFGAIKWVGVQRREHITSDITNVTDIHQTMVQKFENAIRSSTRAMRQLTPFRMMCESDQISLLKYGCLEIIYLRSILSFNSMENGLELSMRKIETITIGGI